ncbi:MAG: glutamate decarboxylase, partial [Pseudomonadota bacterium]
MTLRSRNDIRRAAMDSTFAAQDLSEPLPKYRFPADEHMPRDILQMVEDELLLDGNPRQNLATFCQTWEEPELHQIMNTA